MTFASPYWLVFLPLILIGLGLLLYRTAKARQQFLEAFTSSELAARLLVAYSPVMRWVKNVFLVLGIVLIVLALARPQWGFQYREVKSKGIDILFALDASKSMLAEDIKPNRLQRAKLAILDFVDQLEGDRVGLIAFAGNAFLQCPPTLDYNAFKLSLDAVDTQVIQEGGTDLAAAISEASRSFTKDSAYKFLILITDGEDLEGQGLKRAMMAKDEGLKIYTIGVGTDVGEIIPFTNAKGQRDYVRDEKGNVVKSRLDEKSLIRLAGATEGFYVPLGPMGEGLREVYTEGLGSIPKQEISTKLQKLPLERFQWPLGIALALLALEPLISTRKIFRRGKKNKVIAPLVLFAVFFMMIPSGAQASVQLAFKRYQEGDYPVASALYDTAAKEDPEDKRLPYNAGASAYRAGQYDVAESAFRKALKQADMELQEKSFYNLGNTLFLKGEAGLAKQKTEQTIKLWEEALTHYQSALDLNPQNDNAAHNLEYVKQRLEELKQQQEEDKQQKQDQQDQDQQKQDQKDNQDAQSNSSSSDKQDQNQDQKGDQDQQNESSSTDQQSGDQDQQSGQDNKTASGQEQSQDPHEQSSQADSQDQQGDQQDSSIRQSTEGNEPQQAQAAADQEDPEAMTRYEARKLLDSLKDSEKKLPLNGFGSQPSSHENKPKKDW